MHRPETKIGKDTKFYATNLANKPYLARHRAADSFHIIPTALL
jgi:hypothetical protein